MPRRPETRARIQKEGKREVENRMRFGGVLAVLVAQMPPVTILEIDVETW